MVAGFRIERELEPGPAGRRVWEATQLTLDRRVLLEFLPAGQAQLEHTEVLAARPTQHGLMVATQPTRRPIQLTRRPTPAGAGARSARATRLLAILVAVIAAGSAAALVLTSADPDTTNPRSVPPVPPGQQALGSGLGSGRSRLVDCTGAAPSGASPACTLAQLSLVGRPLVARRAGAIHRWIVKGARGQLALQVLHRRGGRFLWGPRTPYLTVRSTGVEILPATLPLAAGDLVGIDLAPGAAIGLVRNPGAATTARWLGPPSLVTPARVLRPGTDAGPRAEILLRVDYRPGAHAVQPGLLTGRAAATAEAGHRLGSQEVEPKPGVTRTLTLVSLRSGVAIDLLAGGVRLVRLPVSGASRRGQLLDLVAFGGSVVRVRIRNSDGNLVEHDYDVEAGSLTATS